jgi:hypothetical protein
MLQAARSPVRVPGEVVFFLIYLILHGPEVDSVSNRNEFLEVKIGRRLGLTPLPPSMSRMSEIVGASTSRNPKGLYRDDFTLRISPRGSFNSSSRKDQLEDLEVDGRIILT